MCRIRSYLRTVNAKVAVITRVLAFIKYSLFSEKMRLYGTGYFSDQGFDLELQKLDKYSKKSKNRKKSATKILDLSL